jgi:hypothetical protein
MTSKVLLDVVFERDETDEPFFVNAELVEEGWAAEDPRAAHFNMTLPIPMPKDDEKKED